MKMSLRFTAGALLALIMQAVCFAQHYKQTNLVSDTSGVAPVTDPQLINHGDCRAVPAARGGSRTTGQESVRSTMAQGPSSPWSSPFRKSIQITRTPTSITTLSI